MSYFAVALARAAEGWTGEEIDLDEVEDLEGLTELLRDLTGDAAGPALLLLEAALHDPSRPFVAVREESGAPRALEIPQHPSGAVTIRRARLRSPTVPDLGAATPGDIRFEPGPARLVLEWDGPVTDTCRSTVVDGRSGAGRTSA